MPLIHHPLVNKILRYTISPFKSFVPEKFSFAIDGVIKVKLDNDRSILVSGNPTSPVLRMLFWGGIEGFEYDEFKLFKQLVVKANSFMDIGANIGYYSLVAKKYNPAIKLYSFEPLPAAHKFLKANLQLNNITDSKAEQIALSDSNGTANFFLTFNTRMGNIEDQLPGDGSMSEVVDRASVTKKIEVKTQTLDNYIITHNVPKIDLIKIDTEATEHIVFKGAQHVLKEHRPLIMCEVIKNKIESELQAVLKPFGYLYYRITEKGLVLSPTITNTRSKEDYLFVPEEKSDLVITFLAK